MQKSFSVDFLVLTIFEYGVFARTTTTAATLTTTAIKNMDQNFTKIFNKFEFP
jgi:hypothetical protein